MTPPARDCIVGQLLQTGGSCYDAQIITNDREKLGAALGHDVSHSSALAPEMRPEQKQEQAITPQREIAPKQEQGEDFGLGL
jgi:hypothetical protein